MNKLRSSQSVSSKQVSIEDSLWSTYSRLVKEVVIPYQYEALHDRVPDADPSYAIRNFRIAAGKEEGEFGGMVFQDSDLAKWIEAVGYSLITIPDPELEKMADEVIDLIEAAQQKDGYLNTYYTIKEPDKKWTNLMECHEMYCAGHMIEAAVAYYEGTGKGKLLDVVCRLVDHIDSTFGSESGKIQGYDGHQEMELALIKLHRITGDEKHLQLSRFFIEERGKEPKFFLQEWENRGKTSHWGEGNKLPNLAYFQSHLPVREQAEAVGHAVRAVYMYSAMADIAALTNDHSLYEACKRLWSNMVHKQMYITGGIGSTHHGEAFSFDYDLPNDTVYAETCASIGLIFFARRMLQIEANSEYADVMERALYNTVISGISLDGKHYFYVNPLEVWPKASQLNPGKNHVKPVRQKWFGCSCCPPNIARLIASLGEYIYSTNENTIYTHLYIAGKVNVEMAGNQVTLVQETDYPQHGNIKLKIKAEKEESFTLALRIPGWCEQAKLRVNGEVINMTPLMDNGYALIERVWQENDSIELILSMTCQLIESHPQVRANAGKAALQRGPHVYCLEEIDNSSPLSSITISTDSKLVETFDPNLLGGTVVITGEAFLEGDAEWKDELYRPYQPQKLKTTFKAVPYYLWGNRHPGEMTVWIRTT